MRLGYIEHLVISHAEPTTEVNTGEDFNTFPGRRSCLVVLRLLWGRGRKPTQEWSKQKNETVLSRLRILFSCLVWFDIFETASPSVVGLELICDGCECHHTWLT